MDDCVERVAGGEPLAELDALKTPLKDAPLRRALETALPPGRAAALIDVEAEPVVYSDGAVDSVQLITDLPLFSAASAAPELTSVTCGPSIRCSIGRING